MRLWLAGAAGVALMLLAGCGREASPPPAEPAPVEAEGPAPWPHGGMVAAADPRAVEAGLEVLARGGHAVDAAIAVHAVLGLVEPQSSGIGGGAFMLVYERELDLLSVYDGREIAPAAANEGLFLKGNEVMGFIEAWQSGRSVGVPGTIALYKAAHDKHGEAPWESLFEPAITLAEDGFEVTPRLAEFLASDRLRRFVRLDDHPVSSAYFYPGGNPLDVGDIRDNPAYAETLREIALAGPQAFYTGPRAERIVAAVAEEPYPGEMTVEDLASYEIEARAPQCGAFRTYRVCSAPPPSSGGTTQAMILGLYERMVGDGEVSEVQRLVALVDAQRLAYADRDHYLADPGFVPVPYEDLIHPTYLDARVRERFAPQGKAVPGDPGVALGRPPIIDLWGRDTTEDSPGTTHLSVIDANGNAVSLTASVEAPFGNSRMVDGFLLNNQLTDFARDPSKAGLPVANAPAAGKRPRSSMSPTIVFDEDGSVVMVTGSPGGNSIIAYVAKTLVGVLDWGLTAQEAVELPNVVARGDQIGVEVDVEGGPAWAEALVAQGYDVQEREGENSGLHVIVVREDGLEGGADPRREGVARALEAVPAE